VVAAGMHLIGDRWSPPDSGSPTCSHQRNAFCAQKEGLGDKHWDMTTKYCPMGTKQVEPT